MVPAGTKFSLKTRLKSFRYAFNGLILGFKTQHNFRIHVIAFILVILAGIFFRISLHDWCLVLIVSALVICCELINSAIEMLVNQVSPDYNEKAGMIKDLSAAAVLLSAIFAAIIGIFVFWKYFTVFFTTLSILQ
jgi:undecaprenol kinase/diacylglycerol kinase (ATP)